VEQKSCQVKEERKNMLKKNIKDRQINLLINVSMLLIIVYLLIGARPFAPVEKDDIRVALGVQSKRLYNDHTFSYRYVVQAGTYHLINILVGALNLEPFRAFAFLTLVACIIFLLASVLFLKRILHTSFIIALLSLVLFREAYVSGYYANSSMMAAAPLSIGLLLATWNKRVIFVILSAICFSIAIWTRFDSITLGFAFIILLTTNKESLKLTLLFCITAIFTTVLLFVISDISPQAIIETYLKHKDSFFNIRSTVENYATIFTFGIIYFVGFGLYQLFARKHWRLIVLALVAPFPLIYSYGFTVTTPKYLLYALAFFAIPVGYAFKIFVNYKGGYSRILLFGGIILTTGQYVFTPPYELVSLPGLSKKLIFFTADGPRLRGAIAITPVYWSSLKSKILINNIEFKDKMHEYIRKRRNVSIISRDWMANEWLMYVIQSFGYRVEGKEMYDMGQRLIFRKDNSTVFLVRWGPNEPLNCPESLKKELSTKTSILYIGTLRGLQRSFLTEKFKGTPLPWRRFDTIEFQQVR